jgi:hypothetical protein
MAMKNFQLTLSTALFIKDYQWLPRDFNKGELVYLLICNSDGCIGKNGLNCHSGDGAFFELPTTALSIKHAQKNFGIFMTEKGMDYELLYCKEFPINHYEMLAKTQSNDHLVTPIAVKPAYKAENQILKVMIKHGKITYHSAQHEDLVPLF